IARATYAWVAIDTESKKPARPLQLVGGYPPPPDRPNLDAPLSRIPDPVDPVAALSVRVLNSDIDMHLHVNNTRYIAWIEDALAAAGNGRDVIWLQVNFLAEAFAGDVIEVSTGAIPEKDTDEGAIVLLRRAQDGVVLSSALANFGNYEKPAVVSPEREGETISEETLAAAAKIAGIGLTAAERAQALKTVAEFPKSYEKRRKVKLKNELGPAEVFSPEADAAMHASAHPAAHPAARPAAGTACSDLCLARGLPEKDADIAFAPLSHLSAWLRRGDISSIRLCELYLERLKRYDPVLSCVITLTEERALEQAARADKELRQGKLRGPLHGIPWGAKDLLDTKGIPTTWGATPYKQRVPDSDAAVVTLLEKAGAVLLGKLTLGALAYNDIWFGGKTKNPWNLEQGSSGSSSGPAAAAAAGLAGFCIGSETMGSIVSPCLRCGAAGLRPSFGMVPRTGAMSLSWSYDKLGPICRRVEDLGYVLEAIAATDARDPGSKSIPFRHDPSATAAGMRIGYDPEWFAADDTGVEYTKTLETAVNALREVGAETVEVRLPDLPYETLFNLIVVDAAAAFEELTLTDRDDELVRQDPAAWPNSFRAARLFSAVEYVQLQRFRRLVREETLPLFESVDAMISPDHRSDLLVITNSTGQPSLTLRAGFQEDGTPYGVNLWGRFGEEATLLTIGAALETAFNVADRRPPGFEG
ncbi:MAG: hypothetical protein JW852_04110, partial [Spirochaetales bacterium]|nr:hypothetical protein [Spirochaetales bacterium]